MGVLSARQSQFYPGSSTARELGAYPAPHSAQGIRPTPMNNSIHVNKAGSSDNFINNWDTVVGRARGRKRALAGMEDTHYSSSEYSTSPSPSPSSSSSGSGSDASSSAPSTPFSAKLELDGEGVTEDANEGRKSTCDPETEPERNHLAPPDSTPVSPEAETVIPENPGLSSRISSYTASSPTKTVRRRVSVVPSTNIGVSAQDTVDDVIVIGSNISLSYSPSDDEHEDDHQSPSSLNIPKSKSKSTSTPDEDPNVNDNLNLDSISNKDPVEAYGNENGDENEYLDMNLVISIFNAHISIDSPPLPPLESNPRSSSSSHTRSRSGTNAAEPRSKSRRRSKSRSRSHSLRHIPEKNTTQSAYMHTPRKGRTRTQPQKAICPPPALPLPSIESTPTSTSSKRFSDYKRELIEAVLAIERSFNEALPCEAADFGLVEKMEKSMVEDVKDVGEAPSILDPNLNSSMEEVDKAERPLGLPSLQDRLRRRLLAFAFPLTSTAASGSTTVDSDMPTGMVDTTNAKTKTIMAATPTDTNANVDTSSNSNSGSGSNFGSSSISTSSSAFTSISGSSSNTIPFPTSSSTSTPTSTCTPPSHPAPTPAPATKPAERTPAHVHKDATSTTLIQTSVSASSAPVAPVPVPPAAPAAAPVAPAVSKTTTPKAPKTTLNSRILPEPDQLPVRSLALARSISASTSMSNSSAGSCSGFGLISTSTGGSISVSTTTSALGANGCRTRIPGLGLGVCVPIVGVSVEGVGGTGVGFGRAGDIATGATRSSSSVSSLLSNSSSGSVSNPSSSSSTLASLQSNLSTIAGSVQSSPSPSSSTSAASASIQIPPCIKGLTDLEPSLKGEREGKYANAKAKDATTTSEPKLTREHILLRRQMELAMLRKLRRLDMGGGIGAGVGAGAGANPGASTSAGKAKSARRFRGADGIVRPPRSLSFGSASSSGCIAGGRGAVAVGERF